MCRFENILVGLDLARREDLVAEKLSSHTEQAYICALELAQAFSSKLVMVYVLQVSAQTQHLLESEYLFEETVVDKAKRRLKRLVERAAEKGVRAESRVFYGRSWDQLLRQVPRGKHDLVVIGARQLNLFQRLFQRSTGLKLLRSCPCPVWLARPRSPQKTSSILVAVDPTQAGQWALDAGVTLARYYHSDLHILYGFTGPEANRPGDTVQPDAELSRMILDRVSTARLKGTVRLQRADPDPCEAIRGYLEQQQIDLISLGSYSCESMMFDAAEKLYPRLSCSLLAVKSIPVDFVAPVLNHTARHPNPVV